MLAMGADPAPRSGQLRDSAVSLITLAVQDSREY